MRNTLITFGFFKKSVGFVFMLLFTGLEILHGQVMTTTLYSNKMTYISSNSPTTPTGGTGTTFFVGRESMALIGGSTVNYNYRSLLQFNLAAIDPNAIITSATLTLTRSGGINTMQIILARALDEWSENDATWDSPPAYQSADEISMSAPNTSILSVNVKDHIQKMVSGHTNNGWVLRGSVESGTTAVNRHYYSDHYSVAASRPRLNISYYLPLSVASASVTHASDVSENNGSINPVLINGPGGTYTYKWYNAAGTLLSTSTSSPNLSNVSSGWYGLEVTSSVAGTEPFNYAFLVGANCSDLSIPFNPGTKYIDDANLEKSFLVGSQNEVTNYHNATTLNMLTTGFFHGRAALKYRLWIDPQLQINDATMSLMASSVNYDPSYPNDGVMYPITENWNEKMVTYASQPDYSVTNPILIPVLSSAPQLRQFDVADQFNLWKQNNTQNFGWLIKLSTEASWSLIDQKFHSSDAASSSNWPKINFTVGLYDSECMSHAEVKRKLDGGYSYAITGKLKFTLDEEYEQDGDYLPFKIYDKNHLVIESSDMDGTILNGSVTPLPLKFDDNRWTLDISAIPGINKGEYYILETSNNKGDKRYLRFFYKN